MKKSVVIAWVVAVASLSGLHPVFAAVEQQQQQPNPMKELQIEIKTFQEKELAYRNTKQTEMQKLEGQMRELGRQKETADEPTKAALWEKYKPLQKRHVELLEEVGKHEIEVAEQGLVFAQRKLQLAKDSLARFEVAKQKAEEKEALMGPAAAAKK